MISTQNKAFSAGHVTYFDEMSRKNLKTNTASKSNHFKSNKVKDSKVIRF